jgi:hypothetical protein
MSGIPSSNDKEVGALEEWSGWGQTDHVGANLKIISSDYYLFWVSSKQLMLHS